MLEQAHQAITDFFASTGWQLEAILRLVLAALAGGAIGLERELRGRQAGFRTYLLVCLGSALAMIVSVSFARENWASFIAYDNVRVDPGRIAYGIMTGVGFLGAGTIIHNHGSVRGLTTAAGIWCTAAVGLASGFGLYITSIAATLMILAALWLLDYLEHMMPKQQAMVVTLRAGYRPGVARDLAQRVRDAGFSVGEIHFHRDENDRSETEVTLRIGMWRHEGVRELEAMFDGADPDAVLISTREAGD